MFRGPSYRVYVPGFGEFEQGVPRFDLPGPADETAAQLGPAFSVGLYRMED